MLNALVAILSVYAVLVIVGGVIGFVKAKSRASLIAGVLFAAVLSVAAWLAASGSPRGGAGLGALAALALLGRFGPAFSKTKKLMPAGLIVALAALTLALSALVLAAAV